MDAPQKQGHRCWYHSSNCIDNFEGEPDSVLEGSSVFIRTFVADRTEERVEEISVGAVDFDYIEACCHRPFRSICKGDD